MASYNTAQTGVWSDTATWTGGVVPADGSTITVTGGTTLTIDTNVTIGDGTNTDQLIMAGGANSVGLTINTGVTLTIRGNFNQEAGYTLTDLATVTMNHGSHLVFDGNSGVAPKWTSGAQSGGVAILIINGTSGDHCSISTYASTAGNPAHTDLRWLSYHTISYCDFVRLGTNTTTAGLMIGVQGWVDNTTSTMSHCTFTNSSIDYRLQYGLGTSSTITISDVTMSSSVTFPSDYSVQTVARWTSDDPTRDTGSSITMARCGFDGAAQFSFTGLAADSFSDIVSNGFAAQHMMEALGPATLQRWFIIGSEPNYVFPPGSTCTDIYIVDTAAMDNPHIFTWGSGSTNDSWVIEPLRSLVVGDRGDIFTGSGGATIQRCLSLAVSTGANAGGQSYAQLAHGDGATGITCIHNTCVATYQCVVQVGEINAGTAGMYISLKGNLAPTGGISGIIGSNYSANNPINSVNGGDYNAYDDTVTDPYTSTYQLLSQGAHDVVGEDPGFFDSTRNFLTWCRTVRGHNSGVVDTDIAAGVADMVADTSLRTSMAQWVRAGYAPTNVALKNVWTGDTMTLDANGNALNGTVGAMGWVSESAPSVPSACAIIIAGV